MTINPGFESSGNDSWGTPQIYFDVVNTVYHFTVDICANDQNFKMRPYMTEADDSLSMEWHGRIWCNPPYSDIRPWVEKALMEVQCGHAEIVVMLLPASVGSNWFHDLIYHNPNCTYSFYRGRMAFNGTTGAMFDSMLVVMQKKISGPGGPDH